ncbi:MAG: PAS-domain containing protein [Pseudomonadota bacterium]
MNALPSIWLPAVAALALTGILALVGLYCWRQWQSASQALKESRRDYNALARVLETSPAPYLVLSLSPQDALSGLASEPLVRALGIGRAGDRSPAAVMAALSPDGAERLRTALSGLAEDGEAFDVLVEARETGSGAPPRFAVRGVSSGPESAVLWFGDTRQSDEAEQAQAGRDAAWRNLLDALPLPIWRRSEALAIIDCNKTYADSLETTREDVVAGGLELLGRGKMRKAKALSEEALSGGGTAVVMDHVVINGERRLMELREHRLPDGGLIGLAVDRTQLEEVKSELRRHIAAQSGVLEKLGTPIAIYGADLHLTFFNTAFVRLWGVEESFFEGKPHLGDVLETLRERRRLPEQSNFPAFKQELIKAYRTLIEPVEDLMHLPDGTTLRSLTAPHPFGGILTTYEDVTDRLAMETSYNTLIEVQKETLDKLYEGVAVYGVDGRLKLFNPAFTGIWGLSDAKLRNEPHVRDVMALARGFFDLDDADWEGYVESAVAATTEPQQRSGRRERGDGSVIDWAQVPLPDGAVLYTFVDVTDSIRVERALLERNDALETADRLKSEFIANVSYELRTPLNAIIGFAEILENQFFGDLNERQMEYSHAIVESSQRLITLINDILDLASIEAGYLPIELESVDVRAMLEAIHALGRERAHNREQELLLECPDDVGTLLADERRLKQALFNLLSNALKFTPVGGRISLRAERGDMEMLFSVSDTGMGIAEEDQNRVFGQFERGKGHGRQAGAGLGLSLVKSLIELHGGWIDLESEVNGGTKVVCHVPLNAGGASETVSPLALDAGN